MLRCNQCGVTNQQGSKFCGACGAKFTVPPTGVQPQQPAASQPGYQSAPPSPAGRPVPPPPPGPGVPGGFAAPPLPPPTHPARQGPPPPPASGMPGAYPPPGQANYGSPSTPPYQSSGYQQPYQQPSAGYALEKTPQLGWKRKNAGIMCYAFGWLSGIIMYLMEKDAFVRFHAAQSVAIFGGLTVLSMVLPTALPRGLYSVIAPLISLMSTVSMGLWVFLMYKASKGEYYKLPIVGDMVDKFVRDNSN